MKVGLFFLAILFCLAIFAPMVAPYDPGEIILDGAYPPNFSHWFGTDDLGRDVFSRIVFGARISLSVGLVAVLIALTLGILLGSLAGYFGGWGDNMIMRLTDVMLAFPSIFLILTIQVMLSPNIYNVMVIIGLTSWMGVARLIRGEFLSLRERAFVEAARVTGCSSARIIFRHILPNTFSFITVAATLGMAGAILTESSLSFLGLGVQPPMPSWGGMLMDAQAYLREAPWMAIIPGLFIFFAVLSLYLVGEGLRERFFIDAENK